MNERRPDLAIVVVSTNEAHWLTRCLESVFARAGDLDLDVVVADNMSTDGTREVVEERFPRARVVTCANHGFGHANNRGWETTDARYVLFLNPDTEVREGRFDGLVAWMDAHPGVGIAGVKQVLDDGTLYPTARRFPGVLTGWGEAIGADRLPFARLRERVHDMRLYERELECDWVSGSFMLCRGDVLARAGAFDERFFIYSEEVDLCLRIKRAGFDVVHLPHMTIIHHVHSGKSLSERMEGQVAWARVQYARKHFSRPRRWAFLAGIALRYVRLLPTNRRPNARRALSTLAGRAEPPFSRITRG